MSSRTMLDTVARESPVRRAISAWLHAPRSWSRRSTRRRLAARSAAGAPTPEEAPMWVTLLPLRLHVKS